MKTKILLFLLVFIVYLLHQDFWNWNDYRPLIFGFIPIGLAYHVGYSLVAAGVMYLLVKFAWPVELKEKEDSD